MIDESEEQAGLASLSKAAGKSRAVQLRKPRGTGWTKAKRARFLDYLAATCNVTRSARALGMTECSAYSLRRRDAAFAALWHEALQAGYARLEEGLLARAIGHDPNAIVPGEAVEPDDGRAFDAELAIKLLSRHATMRAPKAMGARPRVATTEQLVATLDRKLTVLARRLQAEAERAAKTA